MQEPANHGKVLLSVSRVAPANCVSRQHSDLVFITYIPTDNTHYEPNEIHGLRLRASALWPMSLTTIFPRA